MLQPIEERLAISLPDLKRRGFFLDKRSGSLSWQLGDRVYSTIGIVVNIDPAHPEEGGTLLIIYQEGAQSFRQKIKLEQVRSNLGHGGGIWYFICPTTGERCRTLFSSCDGFVSRHAEGGLRYRSQLCSRKSREFRTVLGVLRKKEKEVESVMWLTKPHSKRSYGGKLTRPMRRYLKLKSQGKKLESKTYPGAWEQ